MIVTKKCLWRIWQVQSTSAENVGDRKEVKILFSHEEHLWGRPDLHTLDWGTDRLGNRLIHLLLIAQVTQDRLLIDMQRPQGQSHESVRQPGAQTLNVGRFEQLF